MVVENPEKKLRRFFQSVRVASLSMLLACLESKSRVTAFRYLKSVGYLTSFTHSNTYYSLADIPQFDAHGLWFFKGIGFSRFGKLKPTVKNLIEQSDAGLTHEELRDILKVRVHNALLNLVKTEEIKREDIGKSYVYLSANVATKARQRDGRIHKPSAKFPTDMEAILILVEIIKEPTASLEKIASRLKRKGHKTGVVVIHNLLEYHGLLKKSQDTTR